MQTSLWLLLSAIGLGAVDRFLVGNVYGWPQPQGLGLSLVVILNILAGTLALTLIRKERYTSLLYFIPAALGAVGLSWRASPWLTNLDMCMIFISMSLALASAHKGTPVLSGVMSAFGDVFNRLPLCGAIDLIVDDIRWRDLMSERVRTVVKGTLKGMCFALPLVLFFGMLFAAPTRHFVGKSSAFLR
jgi:hypothetical protein